MNKKKKRKLEKFLMVSGGIFFLLIFIIIIILLIPLKYEFNFYLEDTYSIESFPVDGEVYFNGFYLGKTFNGLIKIKEKEIYPGELIFKGVDDKGSYLIVFDLTEENLYSYQRDFIFTKEDIKASQLNLSNIDLESLKGEIFNSINQRREENGIESVNRVSYLDEVAQDYADEMLETDLFAHAPEEGYDLSYRLKENNLFYRSASEVLYWSYVYEEESFAIEVVDGWISSPGHRSTVLDADKPILWESAGIGLSCKEEMDGIICYIVGVFANLEFEVFEELEEDYFVDYELYSEGLGFDFPARAKIIFNSTKPMDLSLYESRKEYENMLDRNKHEEIFHEQRIDYFEDTIEIKPGYLLVPHSSRQDSEYTLKVIYNE